MDKKVPSPVKVSPLKVRVFNTCRLRYRYQYVDKIRSRLRIGDTAGSLVHRVLCDIFSKVPKEDRTEDRLLHLFEDGWNALSPRYLRMPGVDRLHDSAVEQLRRFARQHDLQAEPLMVEPYFQVKLTDEVTLFGRVDRIDENPEGTLTIIDYKTGSAPDEIDAGQLYLYAIMIEAELDRRVSQISFWYLDDGAVWTTEFTDAERAETRRSLLAAVDDMANVEDFPPTIGPHCGHCPYLHACEFRDEIEAQRAREGWW